MDYPDCDKGQVGWEQIGGTTAVFFPYSNVVYMIRLPDETPAPGGGEIDPLHLRISGLACSEDPRFTDILLRADMTHYSFQAGLTTENDYTRQYGLVRGQIIQDTDNERVMQWNLLVAGDTGNPSEASRWAGRLRQWYANPGRVATLTGGQRRANDVFVASYEGIAADPRDYIGVIQSLMQKIRSGAQPGQGSPPHPLM